MRDSDSWKGLIYMSCQDLAKYYKALDKALMKYHTMKVRLGLVQRCRYWAVKWKVRH